MKKIIMLVFVFLLTLAACVPGVATPDAMMDKGDAMMTEEPHSSDARMDEKKPPKKS